MTRQITFLVLILALASCHKQLGGPRKIQAIGHIEWSEATNQITQVYYDDTDERRVTMKLHRNYKITGDVTGTWSPSGAQQLLNFTGGFENNSPFPVDYGYYESKPTVAIHGHEIQMSDFTPETYFIVVTKGAIGSVNYERHVVFH